MSYQDHPRSDRRRFLRHSALATASLPVLLSGCARLADKPAVAAGAAAAGTGSPALDALQPISERVVPIADSEYQARLEQARRLMAEQGMDAIFVAGGTSLRYFVDLDWYVSERTAGMLLPRRGEPVYIMPAFEKSRALEQIRFGHDIRTWQENESPYRRIAEALADHGISTGTLGIEERVPYFMVDGITKARHGGEQVSATPVTAGCRAVKSPAELALMQIANEATLAAYRAVWQSLQPGMTEDDARQLLKAAYQRQGVSGGASINVGAYTAQPHGSRLPQQIREDSVVMIDGGCRVQGYTSDITRTFVLGKASDRMKRVFDIVQRAQRAARRAARTGGVMEDIDLAARTLIADAGYGPGYRYFTHRLGHGVGMDMHEWYYAVQGNKRRIVANMTMSDEPGIYIPGAFGVRLEECMYTGDEGGHWFTPQSPSIEQPFA